MLVITLESVPGKTVEPLGVVKGSMIQTKHLGKDIFAGLKTLVGGELKGYTEMMSQARDTAMRRMAEHAEQMGADAVLGVRFTSSAVMQSAAEVMAFGTAVKLK